MNSSFNGIELTNNRNAQFSTSVFGSLISPELFGEKDIVFFYELDRLFLDITIRNTYQSFNNRRDLLVGLRNYYYQVMNGGLSQYFLNKYHITENSAPSNLIEFLRNDLIPFTDAIHGKDSDESHCLRDLSEYLKLLLLCIDQNHIDADGNVSGTEFDACGECDGSGKIEMDSCDMDDDFDSEDLTCSECHGSGEVEVSRDVEFDFDTILISVKDSDVADITLENAMVNNFWPLDNTIELYAEYLFKSVEIAERNNSYEFER